jgi:hypothetical protein
MSSTPHYERPSTPHYETEQAITIKLSLWNVLANKRSFMPQALPQAMSQAMPWWSYLRGRPAHFTWQDTSPTVELKGSSFRFENMITSSHINEIHSLYKSVIYDSECSDSLTYDRDRFVDEIQSADEWIKTSNELMNVADYETMIVHDKLLKDR